MAKKVAVEEMVEALLDPTIELSGWEMGFLSEVTDRVEAGEALSDGQVDKLAEIYREKVSC